MTKIIEKIKKFFSKLNFFARKETQKTEQEECKTEKKPEEQK